MIPNTPFPQILRLKSVIQATGLSRASLYRQIAGGNFPKQIKLGLGASARSVGWDAEDVARWIAECKLASLN